VRHLQVFEAGRKANRGLSCDRLLGFAPVCGPRRRHGRFFTSSSCRRAILPWASSSFRAADTFCVQPRGLDPTWVKPARIINLRSDRAARTSWRRADPSAPGLRTLLPDRFARRNARRAGSSATALCRRQFVRPFSVFEGLMPCHTRPSLPARVERLPV
jgi:hypothetical protein